MHNLAKYSLGVGDRFAHQAKAQLRAFQMAAAQGVEVIPVWNKSHREHTIIGSQPPSVRAAADAAVQELGWKQPYYVDADHIRLDTVDGFLKSSDFFTIDVAEAIGKPANRETIRAFADAHPEFIGPLNLPGIGEPLGMTRADVERIAGKYLAAVQEAGRIYRRITDAKGAEEFIPEVSLDETDSPQTPSELLVILAALADEGVLVQTIAPKFTGRFNKGVDYVGDLRQFEREFSDDLAVLAFARETYGLPENLKLSVHSGSDKFSLYAPMRRALLAHDAGLHLKTAGTTWLEEVIGLAESGGEGLALVKDIYGEALTEREALCAPYAAVIDIDLSQLPSAEEVRGWPSAQFAAAVRHNGQCEAYNPHMRQLLHVGYKIAAHLGDRYLGMLDSCASTIAENVTHNLYARHLKPLFIGE